MPDRTPPVLRTTADDDLFIRMDRALGVPVVNQMVWRLTSAPDEHELEQLFGRLASGRLGRLLRRTGLPLVRDHWVGAGAASGRRVADAEAVADDAVVPWIDAAASRPLDLTSGPVWELRSAPLASGGAVVSLCVAHAAGDGSAVLDAVRAALDTATTTTFTARSPGLIDQAADAVTQAGAITRNLVALARGAMSGRTDGSPGDDDTETAPVSARTSRVVPRDPEAAPDDEIALAPVCIVSVPSEQWAAAAAAAGGSANTLFIAVVVGMLVAGGRADDDDVVRISIPMSLRGGVPDDRANATLGLSLDVPAAAAREKDLATIRALSKDVYAQRTARPGTFVRLQPMMQALGDRAVAALSRGATTPLALASNLGTLDDHLAGLGDPTRAGGIVTRSTTQAISTARLRELRGGLAAWVNDAGHTTTVSVIGLDPDGLGRRSLSPILHAELARWSLTPREW
ncbi:hypothetical protein [Williamsia phyllosphaerae]|uniref:Condensation domain-containing protein n=1 Tax=Williamsia phyllosphaerae TaxID=885042 RepID=A0ABQ1UZA2_9NOCA|nr:hypothetical protein [Williamsia phyllosphaerae]GGF31355.1 hypothetical protein GCM10007298_29000 [Williamsia phyllosphaerae]